MQADSLPAEPQGKPKNTGVGILSLLQQIFPIQELNQGLLLDNSLINIGITYFVNKSFELEIKMKTFGKTVW